MTHQYQRLYIAKHITNEQQELLADLGLHISDIWTDTSDLYPEGITMGTFEIETEVFKNGIEILKLANLIINSKSSAIQKQLEEFKILLELSKE